MMNEDRRQKIIDAAEEIMARKGLLDSSISEIAKKAQVNDSMIYQFFKGKEDLLFSIPGQRMEETLDLLKMHLQGIQDSESKLSKMIWFHLYHSDTHPDVWRVLLLECRSNREFYNSEAYGRIRLYASFLKDILEEGVQNGNFRDDIDLRIVRDLIFGILDYENITCLATGEIERTEPDHADIMSLVFRIVRKPDQREKDENDKSKRILQAAEKIFAEKGFVRAKVNEIAKLAGVAEGTIYEYYKNKEDLLLSIPLKRFKMHLERIRETFETKAPLRKLRRLIRYHFSIFLMERNFLTVFLLHIQLNPRFYESEGFSFFSQYIKVIENIIEEGKRDGSFRNDVNTRVFRNLFLGAFSHMALRWFVIKNKGQIDMMQEIDQLADCLTRALLPWDVDSRRGLE